MITPISGDVMTRSKAIAVIGAVVLTVIAFWVTLYALNRWSAPPVSVCSDAVRSSGNSAEERESDNALAGKQIITCGNAAVSSSVLEDKTEFRFKGRGFARIEGTSGLKCLTNRCGFSVTVTFPSPTPETYQIIIGQSINGQPGWHLLWTPGQLYLQADSSVKNQIVVPFTPDLGVGYQIELTNSNDGVTMLINHKIVARSEQSPLTDIERDVTVGGRDGYPTNGFIGSVTNLRLTVSPG
jgi:hypothetical protein